jgi:5'-methylthioadenosine phosphorylase
MTAHPSKPVVFGVIGGSGVYKIDGLEVIKEHKIATPFGEPSDVVIEAKLSNRTVFFLPRHGKGHRFTPSEVNYRANIYAFKKLGVTHLLSVSAVGIMQEQIRPGDMIVPNQLFDRTRAQRESTFFGDGIVGHVGFADPFSEEMRQIILSASRAKGAKTHDGGTLVVMEGPQFSTRAESHFYRATLKPVAIGMTALPEAKLAREAEIAYGLLAMATDYDCWHEEEADVTADAVIAVIHANAKLANNIVKEIAGTLPTHSVDPALYAAKYAIMTEAAIVPPRTKEKLDVIFGQYLR